MNRKGFTAILDAAFFIILIGLAATVISHLDSTGDSAECADPSAAIDILMGSKVTPGQFGYDGERTMAVSDIAVISIISEDGKILDYLGHYLDELYPWADSYYLELTYGGYNACSGRYTDGWEQSVERSFPVEYGGELGLRFYLST